MATIKNTTTNEITTIACAINGADIMGDMLGNAPDVEGASVNDEWVYLLDQDAIDWWRKWATIEMAVADAREDADEDTLALDEGLISDWGHDPERLHDEECELFGIDPDELS